MLAARWLRQPQKWAGQLAGKARRQARLYIANPMVQPQPLPPWATVDPYTVGISSPPGECSNLVSGRWTSTRLTVEIPDPLTGKPMFSVPDTSRGEVGSCLNNRC
jgi:hypothetical protein